MAKSGRDPQSLGLAIRLRREEMGYPRPELATGANVSYPYLYEVERGKKEPSTAVLERIALYLDISPQELEGRAAELARERSLAGDATLAFETGANPNAASSPPLPLFRAAGITDDLVDRLTAAVIARIEPIVREAIAAAVEEQR